MLEDSMTNFEDLPEEESQYGREALAKRVPCEPGKTHTFPPYETFCLCGALERGATSPNGLPWILTVWPTEGQLQELFKEPHHLGYPVSGKTGSYDPSSVMVRRSWYERLAALAWQDKSDV